MSSFTSEDFLNIVSGQIQIQNENEGLFINQFYRKCSIPIQRQRDVARERFRNNLRHGTLDFTDCILRCVAEANYAYEVNDFKHLVQWLVRAAADCARAMEWAQNEMAQRGDGGSNEAPSA